MFKISDKMYDVLKWVVGVVLPAVATLYVALASVFGWTNGESVKSTIMALVLFLGMFLQIVGHTWAVRRAQMQAEMLQPSRDDEPPSFPWPMSGEMYDTLKWFVQVGLPALAVAYVSLANIWMWPFPEQVSTVVTAVVLFLGAILQLSNVQFRARNA